jgi:hypothetical protein
MRRWIKMLLGMDPLVGMYLVHQSCIGIILGRVETGAEPKYLIHWFCGAAPGELRAFEHCAVESLPNPMYMWAFFYSRKEAERWRDWRERRPRSRRPPSSERDSVPGESHADGIW